jgi:hypothetical protein
VFPLAAILTAAELASWLAQSDRLSKGLKWFYKFHLFIFSILLIALGMIASIPFGLIGYTGMFLLLLCMLLLLRILISRSGTVHKWISMSLVLMIGLNFTMNSFFYPNLLQYQWGNELAKVAKTSHWSIQKAALYKMPNSNAFHFYGQHIFPVIQDSSLLKEGQWIVVEKKPSAQVMKDFPNSTILYHGNRFHVTLLTLSFLNPSTRVTELTPYVLMELKK